MVENTEKAGLERADVLYQLNWLTSEDGIAVYLNGSKIVEWLPHVKTGNSNMVMAKFRDGRTAEVDLCSDQLVLLVKGVISERPRMGD